MKKSLVGSSLLAFCLSNPTYCLPAGDTTPQGTFLFTDNFTNLYKVKDGKESILYTRSEGMGSISSLGLAPDGTVYFSNANAHDLYKLIGRVEELVFKHNTYIRDVGFDSKGNLYFSEATGAGGDGTIYQLEGSTATVFYKVPLSSVGFWAGTFAFDANDALWLSSGNQRPAFLYKVVNGVPQKMYRSDAECIEGFSFNPSGNIIYANWGKKICMLMLPSFARTELYEKKAKIGRGTSDVILLRK